ncbi:MAG: hypothetical protein QXG08_01185 [Candidatus Methanomethyliaceae archaeon]
MSAHDILRRLKFNPSPPLRRGLTYALIALMTIASLMTPIRAPSLEVTYVSGDDLQMSLGGGIQTVRMLRSSEKSSFLEEFNTPPYTSIGQWCAQNNWPCSGNYPQWWGTLWLGVTSDGKLHWHNWLHSTGGAVYDFRMWKDIPSPGEDFELYVPISTWRQYTSGIYGAPTLYIYVELYDKYQTTLFQANLTYNFDGLRVTARIYGTSAGPAGPFSALNLKLWQNSTGAYFSYDNGTSVMLSGPRFLTEPARIQIRFYIWDYNPSQGVSDNEYYINIDRISLTPINSEQTSFASLAPGEWLLFDTYGRILNNVSITSYGTPLSYTYKPPIADEFDDGTPQGWTNVNLASMAESGGYLVTTANVNTWGSWAGARYALPVPAASFNIEASLTYIGSSSDLAELYLALLDAGGSVVAYAGVNDAWAGANPQWAYGVTGGSSGSTGANTMPASGTVTITLQRSGSSWTIKASGAYSGTWTTSGSAAPIQYILLTNTRYYSFNGKTAQWDYVRTDIPGPAQPINGALVGLVNYTYTRSGTFYANSTISFQEGVGLSAPRQSPAQQFTFYDDCSSLSGWTGSSYSGSYESWGYGASGGTVFAWYSSSYYNGQINHWLQRSLSGYGSTFEVSFQAKPTRSGSYSMDARITGVSLILQNGTYVTNSTVVYLTKDVWSNVSYSFSLPSPITVAAVRINIYMAGSYYPSMYTYIDNLTVTWTGDPGLTIKGAPLNSTVYVYQGSTLRKAAVSTGADIVVTPTEISYPFSGSVVLVDRPYLRPAATYIGTLDWNEGLSYSQTAGTLTKAPTGVSAQRITGGSECDSTSGWTFSYNLVSGGQTPTFSASSGYVRFDEQRLYYYYPGYPFNEIPIMEAWYYLRYDLNAMVKNLTVSTAADGSFTYYATADKLMEGWGEIILYVVRGGNWTPIAQSARSTAPFLNVSLSNLYTEAFTPIDMVVVAFHTYARAREGYALYSNPQWGRVDYLRLSYDKIPDSYAGPPVTNLPQGYRVVLINATSITIWPDPSGTATVPKNATSWPAQVTVQVYPPSELYTGTFLPATTYYSYSYKAYTPALDTLFYEAVYSSGGGSQTYRSEFKILSASPIPGPDLVRNITFTFKTYLNGTLQPDAPPRVLIGGVEQSPKPIGQGQYVYWILAPASSLIEVYDKMGVRLSGRLP